MLPCDPGDELPKSECADASGLGFQGLTAFLPTPVEVRSVDLGPGTTLGDVTIIRLVAEGGMGRVYEGLQGMPCRSVAVKVIRPGVLSPEAARRFEHEAHILGRLTHAGIARIYAVGMQQLPDAVVPYFVMEFVEDAKTITAYATQHRLSVQERVSLFRDACKAVAHGHHKGVIHRDLKPGNILVDTAGHPKVIDYGIARSTQGDTTLPTLHTNAGTLAGTLQYMSPEQFEGMTHALDVRTDVYSLGVVLFELLAERSPYDLAGRAVYEVARVVTEEDPRPLSETNPRLRGDLDTIVSKCLEKDREERYSDAAELEADLGRYLRGEPIVASPPRLFGSIVRFARRHRLVAAAAAVTALAAVVALVGISAFAIRSERSRAQAEAARQEALRHAGIAAQEREAARRESSRADVEAGRARQRLYVANTRSLQASLVTRNLRMARQLYAENVTIAGHSLPIELHCLGAQCDEAIAVLELNSGPVERVEFGPDGRTMMAMSSEPIPASRDSAAEVSVVENLRQRTEGARARGRQRFAFFTVDDGCPIGPALPDDKTASEAWAVRVKQAIGVGSLDVDTGKALAESPDGRRRAMHLSDGRLCVTETATGEVLAAMDMPRTLLTRVALDRQGSRVAAQHADGGLTLWDTASGGLVTRCSDKGSTVLTFRFSPDGSRLALLLGSEHMSQRLAVHDAHDGTLLSAVDVDRSENGRSFDTTLAFSPDGSRVVTTWGDAELLVHVVGSIDAGAILRGHDAAIGAVAYSPDGAQIASAAANGHIRLWNASSLATERELMGHDGDIRTLAFCPNGETIASGGADGTVRIWSRTATAPLSVLPGLRGITAIAYRPDGLHMAVAGEGGGSVEVWNPQTVTRVGELFAGEGPVAQIAYSPDGALVATASGDAARVWRTDTGDIVSTLERHPRGVMAVMFSPDGGRLLTTAGDMTARVWDPRTGQRLMRAPAYRSFTNVNAGGAVFGLDGTRVAHDGAHVLDALSGTIMATLPKRGRVRCLAASPDGRILASGMPIGAVYLDAFSDGSSLGRIVAHSDSVQAIAFSPDGTRLATGSKNAAVRLWDVRSGTPIQQFVGHEGSVETILFSPDGGRIITAAADGTVRIWDADAEQELCVLPGQRERPHAIAMSPDGTRLVTAAAGGPVRIWGLSNAAVVRARQAATPSPRSLTWQR